MGNENANKLCPCDSGKKYKKCCLIDEKPQPSTSPISDMIIGVGEQGQIRGVSEVYFPAGFEQLTCEVSFVKLELKNFRQMVLKTKFKIIGNEEDLSALYKNETWKFHATINFLKSRQQDAPKINTPAPIFSLMLNKYLQVLSIKAEVDGRDIIADFDQTPDILILPTSYPPLTPLPEAKTYNYYNKKSTVFYSELFYNKEYDFEITLESSGGSFECAPLFPFGTVKIGSIDCVSIGDLELKALVMLNSPESNKHFPSWLADKLRRAGALGDPTPPSIIHATSFRGEDVLFDIRKDPRLKGKTVKNINDIPEDLILDPIRIKNYELKEYTVPRLTFIIVIPAKKRFDIILSTIKRPLPTRIYEQMQSLANYQDVLVEYDIINLDREQANLRIETEISGYTDKAISSETIAGINNGNGLKARVYVRHCPRLKQGILEQVVNLEKATLSCKVFDRQNNELIFEETNNIDLLPNDQIIFDLSDVRSYTKYNLRNFICAWVNPNDKEGLLDKIRTEASRLHPDNAFGHKISNLADIEKHVKAVYEYLAQNGFNYVNQPFTSRMNVGGQRIVTSERVIRNKSGNCIDLSLLFASILEGLGIYTLIFLMPGHAFIGWGNPKRTNEMIFLETTVIDKAIFEEAKIIGRKNFVDNFLFIGADDPMGNDMTFMSKGSYVVNLEEVRSSGVISKLH